MTKSKQSKSQEDLNSPEISCKNISAEFELLINSLDCFEDCYFSTTI